MDVAPSTRSDASTSASGVTAKQIVTASEASQAASSPGEVESRGPGIVRQEPAVR